MTALVILLASLGLLGVGIGFATQRAGKIYDKSLGKVSDTELLRIMADLGTFSGTELAHRTGMSRMETYIRLQRLALTSGAIHTFYDANLSELYSLRESLLPFVDEPVWELTDEAIIELAQKNYNTILPAHLCLVGEVTVEEARERIKQLTREGVLVRKYDSNLRKYYQLAPAWQDQTLLARRPAPRARRKLRESNAEESLSDATVIAAAVEEGGTITPTQLCLKKDISIDEAKALLNRLQEKDVFEIQVSPRGSMLYHLIDYKGEE